MRGLGHAGGEGKGDAAPRAAGLCPDHHGRHHRQLFRSARYTSGILKWISACLIAAALCSPAHAAKLTGTTSYAYNVNNLGGPATADSALLCYWYNTNQIGTGTILQAVKYVGGTPYETFSARHESQRVTIYVADEFGNAIEFQTASPINTNSTWNQVAALVYPATGFMRVAVNGVERLLNQTLQQGLSFHMPVAGQTWTVGASGGTGGPIQFYSGNLDQVYFHAWDGVYASMVGFFTEACGINLGVVFAPIRPGPNGAYIVKDVGNPVPIIILQGKSSVEFLYNQGGASSFFGGQGMSTSTNDPWVLIQ